MVEKGKKATEEIKDTPEMINRKKEDVRRRGRRGGRRGYLPGGGVASEIGERAREPAVDFIKG